jgi:fermentation-respiration switch protein FrsA (DUF1100 family)
MAGGIVVLIILNVFWYHVKAAFRFCWWGDSLSVVEKGGTIRREEAPSQNWLARISHLSRHPFLFIYSDADELIPAWRIEEFAAILAKRDNPVKFLKFIDSPHVQHYRSYPRVTITHSLLILSASTNPPINLPCPFQEYVEAVTEFIRGVMAQEENPTQIGKDV